MSNSGGSPPSKGTKLDKYAEFKKAYDDYPSQDNEGYVPDRGGFKCGFDAAWRLLTDSTFQGTKDEEIDGSEQDAQEQVAAGPKDCKAAGLSTPGKKQSEESRPRRFGSGNAEDSDEGASQAPGRIPGTDASETPDGSAWGIHGGTQDDAAPEYEERVATQSGTQADWLQHVVIRDEGDYWSIRGTEEHLDEIMRLAKLAASTPPVRHGTGCFIDKANYQCCVPGCPTRSAPTSSAYAAGVEDAAKHVETKAELIDYAAACASDRADYLNETQKVAIRHLKQIATEIRSLVSTSAAEQKDGK